VKLDHQIFSEGKSHYLIGFTLTIKDRHYLTTVVFDKKEKLSIDLVRRKFFKCQELTQRAIEKGEEDK